MFRLPSLPLSTPLWLQRPLSLMVVHACTPKNTSSTSSSTSSSRSSNSREKKKEEEEGLERRKKLERTEAGRDGRVVRQLQTCCC